MSRTKYFLFLSISSIMISSSFSSLPMADATGNQITLEELGVLQLAAHDLFNVDRGDGSSAAVATDFENGLLDLSTLFIDMTSPTKDPFSDADIALGGEPRNRENIILFSVASDIGQNYVDDITIHGLTEQTARQNALSDYHMRFNEAYVNAFGESVPSPTNGCATMTENLAFRTVHDFLPGHIRLDTNPVPVNPLDIPPVIDANDDLFLTIFDPLLGIPTGLGFTPPFDDASMNANGHVGPLLAFELAQPTSELDGLFDPEFLNINIFIPPSTMIVVDLLAADHSFGVQFNTPHSFQDFLDELVDGSYDSNEKVMNEIRNLIAKGYGPGCYVGGEIIPIESTSLILAGAQSFSWMIPVLLSGIGIGLFIFRKSENS